MEGEGDRNATPADFFVTSCQLLLTNGGWLAGRLAVWLVVWLADWLVGWLAGRLAGDRRQPAHSEAARRRLSALYGGVLGGV